MKSDAGVKLVRTTGIPGLTANILNTTIGAGIFFRSPQNRGNPRCGEHLFGHADDVHYW